MNNVALQDENSEILSWNYVGSKRQSHELHLTVSNDSVSVRVCNIVLDGHPVRLTNTQRRLLELFVYKRGQMVTREMLLEHLYTPAYRPGDRVIETFLRTLRVKIDDCNEDKSKRLIDSVYGFGRLLPRARGESVVKQEIVLTPQRKLAPVETKSRVPYTKGPHGDVFTRNDLPSAGCTIKWTASRKAEVVIAVRDGLISRDEIFARYGLSEDEFDTWTALYADHGLRGLRITRHVSVAHS